MQIRKGFGKAVHPLSLEYRIVLAPVHPGADFDGRYVWDMACPYGSAGRTVSKVPVEPTLEVPGLHKVIDKAFQVFVEGVFVRCPVLKYVPDVQTTGVARRADHRRCAGQAIEGLVPDLCAPMVAVRMPAVPLALPREPPLPRNINHLAEGLGEKVLTGTHSVSPGLPKPERQRTAPFGAQSPHKSPHSHRAAFAGCSH